MRKMNKEDTKWAAYDYPVGTLRIYYNGQGVTGIVRSDDSSRGVPSPISDDAAEQLSQYFAGKRKSFDIAIITHGTDFEEKVWAALRQIPYGETRSYKDVATAIGNEKACRAVGRANNKNPICIITPCHRVIGILGKLVGYGGGLDMKKFLLELERKHS